MKKQLTPLIEKPPAWLINDIRSLGWRSHSWQWLKKRIVESLVKCFRGLCGLRRAYIVEMHGGEHILEEVGDKDIDLIVECSSDIDVGSLEKAAEKAVASILSSMLGGDPYQLLRVPNIVELRGVNDYIASRMLSSRYVRPIEVNPGS